MSRYEARIEVKIEAEHVTDAEAAAGYAAQMIRAMHDVIESRVSLVVVEIAE